MPQCPGIISPDCLHTHTHTLGLGLSPPAWLLGTSPPDPPTPTPGGLLALHKARGKPPWQTTWVLVWNCHHSHTNVEITIVNAFLCMLFRNSLRRAGWVVGREPQFFALLSELSRQR